MSTALNVNLANTDLWNGPFPLMEMNNREAKPIFPEFKFKVSGLNESKKYSVALSLEKEMKRLAFNKQSMDWEESKLKGASGLREAKVVEHLSGAQVGAQWMKEGVSFEGLRISGSVDYEDQENVLYTPTMEKHTPIVTIVDVDTQEEWKFTIDGAAFIPVSVYNHPAVGKWKASKNKYATVKNGGKGGQKRKASGHKEDGPAKKRKTSPPVAHRKKVGTGADAVQVDQRVDQSALVPFDQVPMTGYGYENRKNMADSTQYAMDPHHQHVQYIPTQLPPIQTVFRAPAPPLAPMNLAVMSHQQTYYPPPPPPPQYLPAPAYDTARFEPYHFMPTGNENFHFNPYYS